MMHPINNKLIVDQLYTDIKSRILKGDLAPDTKLSVRVLCEYYNVSDTPLKQALNRLVSEQLVVANPRKGMRVKTFSSDEINDACQVREMIELYAVDAALRKAKTDTDFVRQLEISIKEDEKLLENIENMNVYSADTQTELDVSRNFHILFISALKNETIINIYNNVQNHSYVYYQLGIDKNEQVVKSINEHKEILRALKTNDKNALEQAIRNHRKARRVAVPEK